MDFLMSENLSGRQPGGQLPVRHIEDRGMQTECWHLYRSPESSRVGKRRLTRVPLETAASSAVRTALIEYNGECDGVIVVPAGARVAGDMQDADPSGYVRIEFDPLMMPDGAAVPIQAAATIWKCVPLREKSRGKTQVRPVGQIGDRRGCGHAGRMRQFEPAQVSQTLRDRANAVSRGLRK
jgi:hypothetical protein